MIATLPNLEMMRLQINTLFVVNERSYLSAINDLKQSRPPLLFLGRTTSGNMWRFRDDLPNNLIENLENLLSKEPPLKSKKLNAAPKKEGEIKALLEEHRPIEKVWSGPAYYFSQTPRPPDDTVAITKFNKALLQGPLVPWGEDVDGGLPLFASLEGGEVAAVCGSVRVSNAVHEAGVETAPLYRRKGHAARAILAWANNVTSLGALPIYSTSWDNIASQALAKKLGLTFYGADFHIS
jgi:RimJ/RimL family protein N-acetyltransferase